MAKLDFDPMTLRTSFAMAKIVKPESNDFCLRFSEDRLTIISQDRRKFVRSEVKPRSGVVGLKSDDFYLTLDRSSLFDSELDSVSISVNEKSLTINAIGEGQTRQASLKRRAERTRRPPVPQTPPMDDAIRINADAFENLLKQVSCSALVRETKTEEEMRVNQVHFYSDKSCASSNARFFASVSYLPGLNLDLSIISSDIPSIRSFCSKCSSDVLIRQDERRLYISDPATQSVLAFSRIQVPKPPLSVLDDDGFTISCLIDRQQGLKSMNWAVLALDGTQRITFDAKKQSESGVLELRSEQTEISSFPIQFLAGGAFKADFPARLFHGILTYLDDGPINLKFGHKDSPTILQVTQHLPKGSVRSAHFLQSMRSR